MIRLLALRFWLNAVLLVLAMLALAATVPTPVAAQANATGTDNLTAISLPQGNNHVQPFSDLRYLITDETKLDPEMALSRGSEFERLRSAWVDFGKVDGSLWLLMRVRNDTGVSGDWLIDIQRPFADALLVQKQVSGKSPEELLKVDRNTHFEDRPVVSQYLVAPLRMEAGESADILIGLRSSTGSWMPVTFVTPERMRTAHMQEGRTNWLINGAMLALVIIALIMGRLVGWPLVLAFASYVSLSALFVANNEGYLHRFVWPGSMWAYEPANLLLLAGMMIAILQFARLFAGYKERHPKANRAVIVLQISLAIVAALSLFYWQNDAMRWGLFTLVPVAALVYFIIAITAWRDKVLGALPFLAGSLAILFTVATIGAVLLAPGKFPMTVALDYFHGTVLFESMAFLLAILVRMLAVQAELNRSLQAEVTSSHEKLKLAESLQKSRQRYDEARDRADGLRAKLASTSHDLQQPLISLRRGLANIAKGDPASAASLQSALDYLEQLSETGLNHSVPDNPLAGEQPDSGVESFPVSAVLANCEAMFGAEAQSMSIRMTVRPSLVLVRTEPIELMRAISNLISNALKHSGATRLLLGVQERGDHVLLRVVDDGQGMTEQQLEAFSSAYSKGEDSDGHGLGLHLVKTYADNPGHAIRTRSAPDRGTCITLVIPKGGSSE